MAEKELYVVYFDDGGSFHKHLRAVTSLEKAQALVEKFRKSYPRMIFGYEALDDFLTTLK